MSGEDSLGDGIAVENCDDVNDGSNMSIVSSEPEVEVGVQEVEQTFIDLRLRDGMQRSYPYLLDIGRVYNYTKLRFYRRGSLSQHVGEICLFGATFHRPDQNRPIFHLKVPNFTYYLRVHTEEEELSLTLAIDRWIQVANLVYTNTSQMFLTITVKVNKDIAGDNHTSSVNRKGYIREGSIRIGSAAQKTWTMSSNTKQTAVLLSLQYDRPQDAVFSFQHTQLGTLVHTQTVRMRELTGLHNPKNLVTVPLMERSRKLSAVMTLSWDIARDRYLKLRCSGHNLWRKDFVRSDPFFRIKRQRLPILERERGAEKESREDPQRKSLTTLYRSEAYRNLANPEFLPIHIAVSPAYTIPDGFDESNLVLVTYDTLCYPTPEGFFCDWVTEILTGQDEKDKAKWNVMMTPTKNGTGSVEDVHNAKIMGELDKLIKPKAALNDNNSIWTTASLTETLVGEIWDNNWSRSARLAKPTLMGTFELSLCDVIGNIELATAACGELPKRSREFKLRRHAKYNDDEPPASEKARGLPIDSEYRQGRGQDSSNAQSTVLPNPSSRLRTLESRVHLDSVSLNERPSFFHFLESRWCLELAFAIDFTATSHTQHRTNRLKSSWNTFQMLLNHCTSFLSPYTGRGGGDLFGFSGVHPSAEYQVFPIHRHDGAADVEFQDLEDSISKSSADEQEEGRESRDGSEEGKNLFAQIASRSKNDHVDLQGTTLHLAYSRARDQINRLVETSFPVFLLPVIRTVTARVKEVAKFRRESILKTKNLFYEMLNRATSSPGKLHIPSQLYQMADFLDSTPCYTFGVSTIIISSSKVYILFINNFHYSLYFVVRDVKIYLKIKKKKINRT